MPMIDVYATAGTFAEPRRLAYELAFLHRGVRPREGDVGSP
jgi:hypothetical protein